jgi:hypothetical protein
MNGEHQPESIRYMPARCPHETAHAFVPALLLGIWSALLLLDGELHLAGNSVPLIIIAVAILPLFWFIFWVFMLKLLILFSVVCMKVFRIPNQSYRVVISSVFVMACSAFSLWMATGPLGWTSALGTAWMIGFPAYAVWRVLTVPTARSH